jgi:hypothetical protein
MATTQKIINLEAKIEEQGKELKDAVGDDKRSIRDQITANTILLNTLLQQQLASTSGTCDTIVLCDVV